MKGKESKRDMLLLKQAEVKLKRAQAKQDRCDKKRHEAEKAFSASIEERNKAKLGVINAERRCAGLKPREGKYP
jgi:hypothetical protein